jgi:hypothetical protein
MLPGVQPFAASIIAAENGWTPGNMEAAKHVADSMGVGVNDDLKLTDPAAMRAFQRALLQQEQGPGAVPYFDRLASAPAPAPAAAQGGAPAVSLPPTATGIADIVKPPPAVAAAPQPSPAAAAPSPDRQSMNVLPQIDPLAAALAGDQGRTPPPVDPNMLAMALQGGNAPDFGNFSNGGFFG